MSSCENHERGVIGSTKKEEIFDKNHRYHKIIRLRSCKISGLENESDLQNWLISKKEVSFQFFISNLG